MLTTAGRYIEQQGRDEVTIRTPLQLRGRPGETTGYGTAAASTFQLSCCLSSNQTSVIYPDGNTSGAAACQTSSPWIVSPSAHRPKPPTRLWPATTPLEKWVSTTGPATSAAPSSATTTASYDPVGNKLTSTDQTAPDHVDIHAERAPSDGQLFQVAEATRSPSVTTRTAIGPR